MHPTQSYETYEMNQPLSPLVSPAHIIPFNPPHSRRYDGTIPIGLSHSITGLSVRLSRSDKIVSLYAPPSHFIWQVPYHQAHGDVSIALIAQPQMLKLVTFVFSDADFALFPIE